VQALVSDVDGVLTDGRVGVTSAGHGVRFFHMRDGMAVRLLHKAGIKVAWLSAGYDDGVIRARAEYLGVDACDIGGGDKGERFRLLCDRLNVAPARTVYVGDDVNDLPAMALAGLAACPADAAPGVLAAARLVLRLPGGAGCFRELAELILAHP
jgi:YrbI family 3-deoxy-D-manno-octulosonate 8-phosphate phosphatase